MAKVVASRLGLDRSLLRAGQRVCVALSGGADSTALLLALAEANAEREGLGVVLSATHVHHGLRGAEADQDEAFVRALCERLGVPLRVVAVDTAQRMAATGEGLEDAARQLRYAALRAPMEAGEVDVVATAHTLDDQAETVVMKLLRGAWTEGLGGISPELAAAARTPTGRVVRPLLGVRRSEVEAYLRERGQAWCQDSSNQELAMTRNRVRHQLMPLLREFNPRVDEALARTAEIARDEEAYWQAELARVLPMLLLPGRPVRGGGRAVSTAAAQSACALEIERLRALHPALRRRVVRAAARSLGVNLGAEETARVLELAGFSAAAGSQAGPPGAAGRRPATEAARSKPGRRLQLHGGLSVERTVRELQMARTVEEDSR